MRAIRIVILMAVALAYLWFTMGHPEYTWPARAVAILIIAGVGLAFRKAGAAPGDPMTPEPIQSLNLANRELDGGDKGAK